MNYFQGKVFLRLLPCDVIFIAGNPRSAGVPAFEHVAMVAKPPPSAVHLRPGVPQPRIEPDGSQILERHEQLLGLWVYGLPENDPNSDLNEGRRLAPVQAGPKWKTRISHLDSERAIGDAQTVWNLVGRGLEPDRAMAAHYEFHRRLGANRRGARLGYKPVFRISDFRGPNRRPVDGRDDTGDYPLPGTPTEEGVPEADCNNCLGFVLSVLLLGKFPAFEFIKDRWDEPAHAHPYDACPSEWTPKRDHPSPGHLAYALRDGIPPGRVSFGDGKVSRYARAVETLRDLIERQRRSP